MTLSATGLRAAADRMIAADAEPRQCPLGRDVLGDHDIASAWMTQRKTATWQLKWMPTFGHGTKHRDFGTRGIPLLSDKERSLGGSPCTQ